MLRSIKSLGGYTVQATDGGVGGVVDFFFDAYYWAVRYMVVETGSWLVGRRVLIPPLALGTPKWEKRALPVRLTRDQVKNSPPVDFDKPVSRQMEKALHNHYGWPPYWSGTRAEAAAEVIESAAEEEIDLTLRSTDEVIGYDIQATDGEIGHVDDFIVDDEAWTLRYLVVDTVNVLPGKKVLISPTWVRAVAWPERDVYLDLDQQTVKDSPEFDPTAPVNRAYEMRLYDYHGRPAYWTRV